MLTALNIIYALLMAGFIWALRAVPRLAGNGAAPDSAVKLPSLSIVIPACNEADTIGTALSTLLEQDYPDLEIIAVNDRSTDSTGAILEALAEKDKRLKVLHIKELPEGWLGKVHAMHRGVEEAKGDWLLFTDADVHFHKGALRRTLAYAAEKETDHLALLPEVKTDPFILDLSVRTFGLLFLLSTRAPLVNRPSRGMPMGIGAFNLVKADVFRRTPGFEWLRLEPCDDYGLGLMLNMNGARTRFAFAEEYLSITWYGRVGEMFRGLEKNLYGPGFGYFMPRLLLTVVLLLFLAAAPLLGICADTVSANAAAFAALSMNVLLALAAPEKGWKRLPALFIPLGLVLLALMMLNAGLKCAVNGGIKWRGTHYPLKELKKHRRVKFH